MSERPAPPPDVPVGPDDLPADLGSDDLVLLGWPVSHSRSPAIHNAAAAHLGLPVRYRTLAVQPVDLTAVIDALGAAGVLGANVTMPHKPAAFDHCDVVSDEARLIGAVNTLTWRRGPEGSTLEGHTTDALGLEAALAEDVGSVVDMPVLLVGTRGAARAAALALTRGGARITVAGRDPAGRAGVLDVITAADRVGGAALGEVALSDELALQRAVSGARLVMNATSVGIDGGSLPAPFESLGEGQIAYDLIYGAPTPFLTAAWNGGADAHDGLGMLVQQAAASFEHWTGHAAPVDVMREAALS